MAHVPAASAIQMIGVDVRGDFRFPFVAVH